MTSSSVTFRVLRNGCIINSTPFGNQGKGETEGQEGEKSEERMKRGSRLKKRIKVEETKVKNTKSEPIGLDMEAANCIGRDWCSSYNADTVRIS